MADGFYIRLQPEALKLIWHFREAPMRVLEVVRQVMDEQNQFTVGHIQRKYMSFPKQGPSTLEGLRVQTNRLRASLRAAAAQIAGTAVVSGIGSNVKYAGVHETGFQGEVQVPAHDRRRPTTGKKSKSGEPAATGPIQVKAHTRTVNLPARRYISRGIEDRLPLYGKRLSEAIIQTLKP